MLCPSCHSENIEGADQCTTCGQDLSGLDLPGAPQGSQAPDFIEEPLAGLPKRAAPTASLSDPVALAVRLMQSQETGCVLVMDGDHLAGIITGWDILQKVAGQADDLNAVTCSQVMTADPVCLHDEDSIALALNAMASGRSRHVPVLRDDRPTGVIDVIDVFRHLSPHLV